MSPPFETRWLPRVSITYAMPRYVSPSAGTMREIAAQVAAKHGLTVSDLKGPRQLRGIAHPRQEAMWRMRRELNKSLPMIGAFLGDRDHTTVLHGVRAHAKRNGLPE